MNIAPVLEAFTESAPKHTAILGNIVAKDPTIKSEIQPAINTSIETHQSAADELQNITGKPYASGIDIAKTS